MLCKTLFDLEMNLSQSSMTYFYLPELLEINFTAPLFGEGKSWKAPRSIHISGIWKKLKS